MSDLLIYPIIIPMIAAAATLPMRGRPKLQAFIAVLATAAVLGVAARLLMGAWDGTIVKNEVGGWAAPFGIVLVCDALGAIMVVLTGIVGFAVALFSLASVDRDQLGVDAQAPLMLMLLAAVSGAFLTGDLFNLYVWFELMLLSSFVLLTVGGTPQQFEGAVKYVALNLLSSTLFLAAAGLIYGATGTLNMAHLSIRLDEIGDPMITTAFAAPLLVAFAIKAAVFPFFFWLPASYHTPSPVVSALFAGLLTKVGVYSLIRATTLMFDQEWAMLSDVVLLVASVTMISGVLGAVAQSDMRRILSFHIVSQIGYMLMGLGIAMAAYSSAAELDATDPAAAAGLRAAGTLGMAGAVFYILHHIVAKTNLFLIAGAVIRVRGTSELGKLGGVSISHPHIGVLFLISSLALAGMPIFSGFWAKLALVRSGLEGGNMWIVTVSLCVSVLTLFSMTKIWSNAFWRQEPRDEDGVPEPAKPAGRLMLAPVAGLAALSVVIGVFAGPLFGLSRLAANQLLNPSSYVTAVDPLRAMREFEDGQGGKGGVQPTLPPVESMPTTAGVDVVGVGVEGED
ncbi:MAG: proton-conducting transporter membrane subunit [Planctomycetota bacterium]